MMFLNTIFFKWNFINKKLNKTPLFEAVANENIEIIKLLLMNDKADVNIVNKYTYNANENKKYMDHLNMICFEDIERLNNIVVTNVTVINYAVFKLIIK